MNPDLRQLQALVAVADHGNLGRAADTLACSPSALSMQLTALQQQLGKPLLRRTGRGLALLPEAEPLLQAARQALAAVAQVRQLAQAPGDVPAAAIRPTPLSLGTVLDPAALRLGEVLQALRARGPQVLPELRHAISGQVLQQVREGRLDAGFCLGQPDPARLRLRRLATVRYVVIAPRGWQARLAGRGWEALAELPWISTPPASVHHQLLAPVFARLRRRPQAVAHVDQEASMVDLVRAGFGLSLAREAVALRAAAESGLAVSRQHALDTGLWLVAAAPATAAPNPDRAAALDLLFEVAAGIWRADGG